ncbi:MAG: CARDB domain-containing protein [Methanosarcinaceae archaeon]
MIPGIVSAGEEDYISSGDGNNSSIENLPDLVIETLTTEPENPEPGDMITITAIVKNQGTERSIKTNLAYNIDLVGIGEREIPELDPGSSSQISETWTPSTEGKVNILVWADSENYVSESDEWNNEKTASIEVKKQTYPDLVVETISSNPTEPEPGQTATVTVTVKNLGTEKSGPTNLEFYVDGVYTGEEEIPDLNYYDKGSYLGTYAEEGDVPELTPESSSEISFEWTPETEGETEIRAVVDSEDIVPESDEENNEKTLNITAKKKMSPDLIITAFSVEPDNLEPGETVNIAVTVRNRGNERSGQTNIAFYVNEGFIGEVQLPELSAKSSLSRSYQWVPETEGIKWIRARVDEDNLVFESNEWNNDESDYVVVEKQTYPDLVIEDFTANPSNPEPGETVILTTIVKNQGNEKSDETDLTYYIAGSGIGKGIVPELEPESSLEISFPWIPETEETVNILAWADAGNQVEESNEWNNEKTVSLEVTKQTFPDLIIETLTADPSNPKPGDTVTVKAIVKNQGTEKSPETDLEYYIDETWTGERKIPGIEPGSSSEISFAWIPATEEPVNILAKADAGNQVEESNEENNEKTVSIDVIKQTFPDLVIEDFVADLPNPEPGETVILTTIVKNQGTEKSPETDLEYYIAESDIGERIIPDLEPESSSEISFSWTPETEETVNIRVQADAEGQVTESDEGNNEETVSIRVEGQNYPDLVVEDLSWEPSDPETGKPLNFTLKVKNQGLAVSPESIAKYYINGTPVGEISIPLLLAGSETNAEFSLTPDKEGVMEVKVHLDFEDKVPEGDDTNNEFTKEVSVKTTLVEYPDLVIDSLTWTPEKPEPNESVTFTVTVKNTGTAGSEENVLEYEIDGASEGNLTVPALSAGETFGGTFSWVAGEEGKIEVRAVVDTGNEVLEGSETNNEITKTITVAKETVVSSGGGGGGGGGSSSSSSSSSSGGSKEPARNVEVKELSTRHIINGYHVRYEFPENVTCITIIEFDPKRTFKKTTTTVEVLKEKSAFASNLPPGRIYKNLNIWVGDKGAGLPEYLDNAYIEFRVEKSWIEKKGINESLITLLHYDKKWNPLETEKMGENEQYFYFKATTPGFSPFAITEYTGEEEETIGDPEGELKGVPSSLGGLGEDGVVNGSAEIEENAEEKKPVGMKKVLVAISLPIFMILVQFLVLKKRD